MTERSRRVVLLIDYDNLQICAARDTPGRDLQLTPVVQLAQRYGTVILARAYAEWNLSTERLAVYKAGIEPAFAPVLRTESDRSGKSLADTVMVAEGMDMLWTLSPEVVVLATSDKDLIPLVRVAKQRGAFVVVLGSDFTAIPLREMADEHLTYRQLITETGVRYATEAGPGRQPAALPEPSRRRRERTGRERATGATTAPAATPSQPRPEREAPAAAAAATAPAAAPVPADGAAEPVAPVTAGAAADADAQTSGRRRRRRGSRRRSDRLGVSAGTEGEADALSAEDGEDGEDAVGAGEAELDVEVITPTSSALDAPLSAVEVPEEDAAPAPEPVEPSTEPVPEPRVRRTRRTRRTATAEEPEVPTEPVVPAQPVVPEQSADILPAPPPDEASVNGAPAEAQEPAPAPRPRARRVASASRGRSRRP
jgi:uncharacterized LabA/DUF88 family protein